MNGRTARKVLVVRPESQSRAFAAALRVAGFQPVVWPAIAIVPPEDDAPLRHAVREIDRYPSVVFTSANGVRFLFKALENEGRGPDALAGKQLAAAGPATAAVLTRHGLPGVAIPHEFRAESLAGSLNHFSGPVLVPQSAIAAPVLVNQLRARGLAVNAVAAYRPAARPMPPSISKQISNHAFAAIAITSGSTARALAAGLRAWNIDPGSMHAATVAIGPATAAETVRAGLRVDLIAQVHTSAGMVDILSRELP